jgi:beta-glucosidase-like glycosyl hydrolase
LQANSYRVVWICQFDRNLPLRGKYFPLIPCISPTFLPTGFFVNPYSDPNLLASVYSDDHREVARQTVHESLVLLKNENNTLPLEKNSGTVLVSGEGASSTVDPVQTVGSHFYSLAGKAWVSSKRDRLHEVSFLC